MQNVVGAAHGNEAAMTEPVNDPDRPDGYGFDEVDMCMVGYCAGVLYDNIYDDDDQDNDSNDNLPDSDIVDDTFLLSSSANYADYDN